MKDLYKTENSLDPVLVLEFEIDSDIDSVYNAWTEIDTFQKWFCPTGFSIARAEMNPVNGGFFRIHMKSPEGEIYPTKGEYILLEKPNRIVYKDSWDDDRENNEPVTTEITFTVVNAKTLIKLFSSFSSAEQKENILNSGVVDGWKMFLNNLNELLK
ncbi:MAG: SRPBCC domain-containing protein [Melioribacteraceae bacterium]|nr:SRPBCC domain-containing protein [Melioribacteraceae bacterium]MCF8263865.1 SRPBCC domain-containing protein [Melioribacteraceae bacterium]